MKIGHCIEQLTIFTQSIKNRNLNEIQPGLNHLIIHHLLSQDSVLVI
jgi:hypothetical protein